MIIANTREIRRQLFLGLNFAIGLALILSANLRGQERPPELEVLRSVEDGGGIGMELHRVTIRGVAKNDLGEPVAGAEIFVGSTNRRHPTSFERLLGKTRSSATGKFELKDVQLLVLRHREDATEPTESQFTIFGVQQDHGFVWRESIGYRPEPRPDKEQGPPYYQGDDIKVDLTFELGSRLRGRITDDRGEPLANAKIQVGYIDNLRNPDGNGMYRCQFLGSDALPDTDPSTFNAIGLLPAKFRETRTDADGNYELLYLRRHCTYLAMVDPGLEYMPHQFELVTSLTRKPSGRTVVIGEEGKFDWSFPTPERVEVHVVFEDTRMPAKGVSVIVEHSRDMRRLRAPQKTDAEGHVLLTLKPGAYTLTAETTPSEPYLVTRMPLDVRKGPLKVSLKPAALGEIWAKDQDGENRGGVRYVVKSQENGVWRPLHSHPTVADYPPTNRKGRLSFAIAPGRYRFARAGDSYEAEPTIEGDWVELQAGENPVTVLEAAVEKKEMPKLDPAPIPAEIAAAWAKQTFVLADEVRVSMRRVSTSANVNAQEFEALTRDLDLRKTPDIGEIVKSVTGLEQMGRTVIVSRGLQRREDRYGYTDEVWPEGDGTYTVMFNGREGISHQRGNNQVDVHLRSSFRMGIQHVRDLSSWPMAGRPGAPQPTVTNEGGDLLATFKVRDSIYTQRIDAKTGFVYSSRTESSDRVQGSLYFAPRRLPNGMLLCQAMIKWTSVGDRMQRFEAALIDDVQTPESLAPSTFSLALPPGTIVVDHRSAAQGQRPVPPGARPRPSTRLLRRPVIDLAAYLQQ